MGLSVIGAGFGRTGTESLKRALEILGLGPCHHMYEVIGNEAQTAIWREIVEGRSRDWDRAFKGYRSAVDWPSAAYWRETMEIYPEAKVILSHRDTESWWTSFEKTIGPSLARTPEKPTLGRILVGAQLFDGRYLDRDHACAVYEASNAEVRATVPAERLIDVPLGSGWAPLCAGLGLSIPDVPYPSGNDPAAYHARGERSL